VARFGLRARVGCGPQLCFYLRLACNSSLLHFWNCFHSSRAYCRSPEGVGDKKRRREGVCEVSSTQKHLDFFSRCPKIWPSISGLRKEKLGAAGIRLVRVSLDDKSTTTTFLRLCGWHRKIVEILEIKEITFDACSSDKAVKRGVREKKDNWEVGNWKLGAACPHQKAVHPSQFTSDAMNGWVWKL
jgi:hypothetical protein